VSQDDRPVSVSRFERKLRAITGASGSQLLRGVADHVSGLIVLESDRPEWAAAGDEMHAESGIIVAAGGAGTFAYAGVRNRQGTNTIVVLERVLIGSVNAIQTYYDFTLDAVDATNVFFARDFRLLTQAGPTPRNAAAQLVSGAAAAAGGEAATAAYGIFLPGSAGVPYEAKIGVILPPATGLTFYSGTANTGFTIVFFTREIPMEGGAFG